jgi:hypothetical protein
MRVRHDFLTHFTQYSKPDNINCHQLYQVSSKNFLQHDAESVSQETKCSILKCYENMKQDRPDLSYDEL